MATRSDCEARPDASQNVIGFVNWGALMTFVRLQHRTASAARATPTLHHVQPAERLSLRQAGQVISCPVLSFGVRVLRARAQLAPRVSQGISPRALRSITPCRPRPWLRSERPSRRLAGLR